MSRAPNPNRLYTDKELFTLPKHREDINHVDRSIHLFDVSIKNEKGDYVDLLEFHKHPKIHLNGSLKWSCIPDSIVRRRFAQYGPIIVKIQTFASQWCMSWADGPFDVGVWFETETCWFALSTADPSWTSFEKFKKLTRILSAFVAAINFKPSTPLAELIHQVAHFGRYSFTEIISTLTENASFVISQLNQAGFSQHALTTTLKNKTFSRVINFHFPELIPPDTTPTLVNFTLPRYGKFYKCPHVECEKVFTGTFEDMRNHFAEHLEKQKKLMPNCDEEQIRKGREINRRNLDAFKKLHSHLDPSPNTALPSFVDLRKPVPETPGFEYTVSKPPMFHPIHPEPMILFPERSGWRNNIHVGQPPDVLLIFKTAYAIFGEYAFHIDDQDADEAFSVTDDLDAEYGEKKESEVIVFEEFDEYDGMNIINSDEVEVAFEKVNDKSRENAEEYVMISDSD